MPIAKELKEAILRMPAAEKDKLLIRIISKDLFLCKQLTFKLLHNDSHVIEKRNEIAEKIILIADSIEYSSPGWLLMDMRDLSGDINNHFAVSKDKYGEIFLQFLLMAAFVKKFRDKLEEDEYCADTFARNFVSRCVKYFGKLQKLHEDFYVELEENVNIALDFVHNYSPCEYYLQGKALPKKFVY